MSYISRWSHRQSKPGVDAKQLIGGHHLLHQASRMMQPARNLGSCVLKTRGREACRVLLGGCCGTRLTPGVGDHDDAAAVVVDGAGQRAQRLPVKVVGRLVQHLPRTRHSQHRLDETQKKGQCRDRALHRPAHSVQRTLGRGALAAGHSARGVAGVRHSGLCPAHQHVRVLPHGCGNDQLHLLATCRGGAARASAQRLMPRAPKVGTGGQHEGCGRTDAQSSSSHRSGHRQGWGPLAQDPPSPKLICLGGRESSRHAPERPRMWE